MGARAEVLAWSLGGLISGAAVFVVATPSSDPPWVESVTVACDGFRETPGRTSLAHLLVANRGHGSASFLVRYLDPGGALLYSERFTLGENAEIDVDTWTGNMGSAVEVISADPLRVRAFMADARSGGPEDVVPCVPH
jgi:hypothetical protein